MAGNDYRGGKRQVSFVVDTGLWGAAKGVAVARGWSVTRLITELLEKEVGHGVAGVGSGDSEGSGASGGVHGAHGGGSGGSNPFPSTAGRGIAEPAATIAPRKQPDWDAILASGFAAKSSVVQGVVRQVDPIEEIA